MQDMWLYACGTNVNPTFHRFPIQYLESKPPRLFPIKDQRLLRLVPIKDQRLSTTPISN